MKISYIDHGRRGNRDGYTMCKVSGVTRLMHRVVHKGLNWKCIGEYA
uniref:Uncharacterized protein n=1 Tax=Acinetobacter phage vB_Ab_1137_KEN_01 TaxID=3143009 RepID=A0AAU8KY02_9VIRU